jgi:hypothetical protein
LVVEDGGGGDGVVAGAWVGQVCLFVVGEGERGDSVRQRLGGEAAGHVCSVRRGRRVGKIAGVGYGAEVGVYGGEGALWDVPGTKAV